MKTNFLGGARKEGFRCTAKVLKLGRRLIYGLAECIDGRGRLLTHHTITYIRDEK
jgi:acyl-coenzyme A thioesterase PaaI-like protein